MKINKLIMIVFLGLGMICVNPIIVHAEKDKGADITVTYTKAENDKYKLSIQIEGERNGKIYDGSRVIKDQISLYELEKGEQKKFILQPNEGYIVGIITLNGKDITKMAKSLNNRNGAYSLRVSGKNYEQDIRIRFEKTTIYKKDSRKANPVNTDDKTKVTGIISTLIASIVTILFLLFRKKKKVNGS